SDLAEIKDNEMHVWVADIAPGAATGRHYSISCDPAWLRGLNAIRSIETARVHDAARRRGGVALGSAGAAVTTEDASHRHHRSRSHVGPLSASTTRTWLRRRSEHRH